MNNTIQPTNFKGAFKLNYKYAADAKIYFESLIGKNGVQIFDKFNGKDYEVMYLLSDSKDEMAAKFLAQDSRIRFSYYPEINANMRFSSADEIIKYIKNIKPTTIKLLQKMQDYIIVNRPQSDTPEVSAIDIVSKLLKSLRIKIPGEKTILKNGVIQIRNKKCIGFLNMSPQNSNSMRYVYIKPNNLYEPDVRCLVDKDGAVIKFYNTPDEIIKFSKRYTELVRAFKKNNI